MWNRRKCHLVNVTVFEGELEKHLLSLIDIQKLFLKTGRILLKYLSWMAFFFPAEIAERVPCKCKLLSKYKLR